MKPPRHFGIVLGRIAHVRIGGRRETLCGRPVGDNPTRDGLDAAEAQRLADCRTCRGIIRPPTTGPGICRVCGCTEDDCSCCIERTGEPCHWVEPDLCSACAGRGDHG